MPPRQRTRRTDGYTLEVPLDASQVEGLDPKEQAVRVVLRTRDDSTSSQTVRLDAKGGGTARFTFGEKPGALRLVVGPEAATEEELLQAQTIGLDISVRQWDLERTLTLPPILISPFYWHWWLRWCRTFTIRGRVLCPDGSPVPGATVCASDVDLWWWWSSVDEVGCATTDVTGSFELKFRFCCGFWPWWWWRSRFWRLEPFLAERIMPVLQQDFDLPTPPVPSAKPDLAIFDELLAEEGLSTREPQPEIYPVALEKLRGDLLERIRIVPELERLHVWPWRPWHPWWDCSPDIIFKVTQECGGQTTVIVDEDFGDIRWNIPTTLDVTLVAQDACCIEPDDCPEGNCMVITQACDDPVASIGGNPGALPAPAGYRNPGAVAVYGDRPYGGIVPIRGLFGDAADVDYYEFEWSDDGGFTWNDMPLAASGGFSRTFWGPPVGAPPFTPSGPQSQQFSFTNISGRRVIESREHFEANNDPGTWGVGFFGRYWTENRDLLIRWITQNTNQSLNFADGTFQLRVKSWDLNPADNLVNMRILPLCGTPDDNGIVLTIDNRLVGGSSGHPTTPDHLCGGATVHDCTTEPDTDFLGVRINGVAVDACAEVDASEGGTLEIDFMAHDPGEHLAYYTLRANYKENLSINLLDVPGATLTPGLVSGPVPPAAQVGPYYGHPIAAKSALGQGATAPVWSGGKLTLTISDLSQAFPETCCYQLELHAFKRTIHTCNDNWPDRNRSHFTLTVTV